MNNETQEAFPSWDTLCEKLKCGKDRLQKSIKKMDGKCFTVRQEKNKAFLYKNIYKFPVIEENFGMIRYDFLDKKDLDSREKGFLLALFEWLDMSSGWMSSTDFETDETMGYADLINMSKSTFSEIENSLIEKEYVNPDPDYAVDGAFFKEYDLEKLGLREKENLFKTPEEYEELRKRKQREMYSSNIIME